MSRLRLLALATPLIALLWVTTPGIGVAQAPVQTKKGDRLGIGRSSTSKAEAQGMAEREIRRRLVDTMNRQLEALRKRSAPDDLKKPFGRFCDALADATRLGDVAGARLAAHRGPDETGGDHEIIMILPAGAAPDELVASLAAARAAGDTAEVTLEAALRSGERAGVAKAWSRYLQAAARAETLALQRAAYAGRADAGQGARVDRLLALMGRVKAVRDRTGVILVPVGDRGLTGAVAKSLGRAAGALGARWKIQGGGDPCARKNKRDMVELQVSATMRCQGGGGQTCTVRVDVDGRPCTEPEPTFRGGREVKGEPAASRRAAEQAAIRRVAKVMRADLYLLLAGEIPLL